MRICSRATQTHRNSAQQGTGHQKTLACCSCGWSWHKRRRVDASSSAKAAKHKQLCTSSVAQEGNATQAKMCKHPDHKVEQCSAAMEVAAQAAQRKASNPSKAVLRSTMPAARRTNSFAEQTALQNKQLCSAGKLCVLKTLVLSGKS